MDFNNKRYYKDPAAYAEHMAADKPLGPHGIQPAWFWQEVHPLAGFALQCDGAG